MCALGGSRVDRTPPGTRGRLVRDGSRQHARRDRVSFRVRSIEASLSRRTSAVLRADLRRGEHGRLRGSGPAMDRPSHPATGARRDEGRGHTHDRRPLRVAVPLPRLDDLPFRRRRTAGRVGSAHMDSGGGRGVPHSLDRFTLRSAKPYTVPSHAPGLGGIRVGQRRSLRAGGAGVRDPGHQGPTTTAIGAVPALRLSGG